MLYFHHTRAQYNDQFAQYSEPSPLVYIEVINSPTITLGDKKIPREYLASCVLFAKSLTGYNKPVGKASNWPINSQIPEVGSVVVFKYAHVAIVTKFEDGIISIKESNYIPNQISTRSLPFDSPSIKGYWIN